MKIDGEYLPARALMRRDSGSMHYEIELTDVFDTARQRPHRISLRDVDADGRHIMASVLQDLNGRRHPTGISVGQDDVPSKS